MILFSWLARVFDRYDGRSNLPPPLPIISQANLHEIRARSVTYYQVLIDTRDMPNIRAQTGLFFHIHIFIYHLISSRSCNIFG